MAAGKKRMKLFSGSRKVKMKEIDTDEKKKQETIRVSRVAPDAVG